MPHSSTSPYNAIIVLGPTASGKTHLGVSLARQLRGTILSADSRQVYRGMDIGTGKDLSEYGEIPYQLIDILPAGASYSLFHYARDFINAFNTTRTQGRMPVIVGGTGLYLDAIVFGYEMVEVPQNQELRKELSILDIEQLRNRLRESGAVLHNTTDLSSRTRLVRAIEISESPQDMPAKTLQWPEITPLIFGINWPPEILRKRIAIRLKQRIREGMIAEARQLHQDGLSYDKMAFYGLEYGFLARHLQGELNRNDMTQKLCSAISQFAKRQRTWFRRMERKGTIIHWLDPEKNIVQLANEVIGKSIFSP
jgi:tRNA dimethylallyltransferase